MMTALKARKAGQLKVTVRRPRNAGGPTYKYMVANDFDELLDFACQAKQLTIKVAELESRNQETEG